MAVPRNAFLQPEALVEQFDDHRREVRARVDERTALLARLGGTTLDDQAVVAFVEHLAAEFDPSSCASCALFNFCRSELRASTDPLSLLVEIGVKPETRPAVAGLVSGTGTVGRAPESVVAGVRATLSGLPVWSGQRRIDPVGAPGSINVVLAKADAAALGIHGIGLQRVRPGGVATDWEFTVFDDPQAPATRAAPVGLVGEQVYAALVELQGADPNSAIPVHLVR